MCFCVIYLDNFKIDKSFRHVFLFCVLPPSDRHICESSPELHEERVQCSEGPARQSGWRHDQSLWQHGSHVRKTGPGHQTVNIQGTAIKYCIDVFCILAFVQEMPFCLIPACFFLAFTHSLGCDYNGYTPQYTSPSSTANENHKLGTASSLLPTIFYTCFKAARLAMQLVLQRCIWIISICMQPL